ncbi:hypothetical protein ANTQUA_LOCUS8447 [Anthophora quadrimaculata]
MFHEYFSHSLFLFPSVFTSILPGIGNTLLLCLSVDSVRREPISDPSKPSCTLQPAATPANIGNGGDVEERRSGRAVTKACATHLDLDAHIVNQLHRDP